MKIAASWARYRAGVAAFVDEWAGANGMELLAFGVGVDAYFAEDQPATAMGCPRLSILLDGPGFPAPAMLGMSIRPELWEQAQGCRKVIAAQLRAALDCLRT